MTLRHYSAVFAGLMCLAPVPPAGADGLVGHWRFDEADGEELPDASGSGRHGRILNGSRGVERVAGRRGGALKFTGGDPANRDVSGCSAIPGMGDMDWSKGITIEVWVRFTGMDRPSTYELVSNSQSDRGRGFRLMLTWLRLAFRSGEGGNGETWGATTVSSETSVRTGEWYHVAASYAGGVFRVYLDGALVAESEEALALTGGEPTIWLGAYRAGYAYGLSGLLDELKLYDYARTPVQIAADAKLGL